MNQAERTPLDMTLGARRALFEQGLLHGSEERVNTSAVSTPTDISTPDPNQPSTEQVTGEKTPDPNEMTRTAMKSSEHEWDQHNPRKWSCELLIQFLQHHRVGDKGIDFVHKN